MFDSLFFWTGVVTWFVISYILLLVVPVGIIVVIARACLFVSNTIDNKYYDDVGDVEQAREDGKWYYYVGHYAVIGKYRLLDLAKWYADAWVWIPHKLRRAYDYPF
jgi:hypothetical protein